MLFTYHAKCTADDDWTHYAIEATDRTQAQEKLDKIYGITMDESGTQTN